MPQELPEGWKLDIGRMERISVLIDELTAIKNRFGNTCVYITGLSWGAVALNEHADDEKLAREQDLFAMNLLG